jgi:DeoR/GlpR family transcriptional regulator of sugar metabolism
VHKHSQVTLGAEAVRMFQQVHVDLCIIGVCSLHHEIGVTTNDYNELEVGRAMLQSASRVVAVTTYDKMGTAELYRMCDISVVESIITEADSKMDLFAPYLQLGINII